MSQFRKEKISSLITYLASEFVTETITDEHVFVIVTRINLSDDLNTTTIAVTVDPEERAEEMIAFLTQHKGALRKKIADRIPMKYIPEVSFVIDKGEKNRERIEELIAEWKNS